MTTFHRKVHDAAENENDYVMLADIFPTGYPVGCAAEPHAKESGAREFPGSGNDAAFTFRLPESRTRRQEAPADKESEP